MKTNYHWVGLAAKNTLKGMYIGLIAFGTVGLILGFALKGFTFETIQLAVGLSGLGFASGGLYGAVESLG